MLDRHDSSDAMLHLLLRSDRFLALELVSFALSLLRGIFVERDDAAWNAIFSEFFSSLFFDQTFLLSHFPLAVNLCSRFSSRIEKFFDCVCLIVAFRTRSAEPFLYLERNSRLEVNFSQPSTVFILFYCAAREEVFSPCQPVAGVYIKQIKNMQMRAKIQRIISLSYKFA
jgi:hypothetical protein